MIKKNERPFIISVFLPQAGCPHQCTFCNQQTITNKNTKYPPPEIILSHIESFLKYKSPLRTPCQIAFYGGNFLGLPHSYIQTLLCLAQKFINDGKADSIRFSTRPDTISKQTLDLISKYSVYDIELGAQSMDENVLKLSQRGHSVKDTFNAVMLLKDYGSQIGLHRIGLQMMIGLPGESSDSYLKSGQAIAELCPDFVRIYPTIVLKNSLLAKWHKNGSYVPLTLDQAVKKCKELWLLFQEKNIPVIRMGLQSSESLEKEGNILAGPFHPAFGHLVYSEIFFDKAVFLLSNLKITEAALRVHPRNISKMRGLKNANIKRLYEKFNLKKIQVIGDESLSESLCMIKIE